jgi:salicylate hydroxylase
MPHSISSDSGNSESPPPFKIAIIGAGIGGLTFAIGCLKNNVPYTLYESADKYSIVGAGVGLGPNALRAMDMIEPRLRAMYNDISSGNLTANKNHVMMDALYAEDGFGEKRGWVSAPFGASCYERTSAHRRDLLDILTSMIPRDTVRFSKRVKSMEQLKDRVAITFEDGEVAEASAVVGSDGGKGPTRKFVLEDQFREEVAATYSGKYVYRSIIPMKDALDILGHHAGDAKAFIGHNVHFITFPISKGTQCNLVAFKYTDEPWIHNQWTKRVTKEQMVADFADGVDKRLVKLLDVSLLTPPRLFCQAPTGLEQTTVQIVLTWRLNSGPSRYSGHYITTTIRQHTTTVSYVCSAIQRTPRLPTKRPEQASASKTR